MGSRAEVSQVFLYLSFGAVVNSTALMLLFLDEGFWLEDQEAEIQ